jgi:hypothetical protein
LYYFSSHVTNTEYGTPPHILREHIVYIQKEYDELREFTTLEKQICNPVLYKEVCDIIKYITDISF